MYVKHPGMEAKKSMINFEIISRNLHNETLKLKSALIKPIQSMSVFSKGLLYQKSMDQIYPPVNIYHWPYFKTVKLSRTLGRTTLEELKE